MASRNYLAGVEAGLMTLSQGTCYWPACPEATVQMVKGRPMLNVEIAHIAALNPAGRRYDPSMTDQERNSFPNLLLLCKPHHKTVDGVDWADYPVKLLFEWKEGREGPAESALRGLGGLTEERLEQMLTETFSAYVLQLNGAIDRLEDVDFEAAQILRTLVGDLGDLRASGALINPDSAELLHDAASRLHGMSDVAENLRAAAAQLESLSLFDAASALSEAAYKMQRSRPEY